MPGPVFGLSAKYSLTKTLSVVSGIDYTTLYYNYSSYQNEYFWPLPWQNSASWPPYSKQDWSFSYLRFPLLLSLQTPGNLSFNFSAGLYYSELIGDNSQHYEENFPSSDYGFMFVHGVNYQFQNHLKLGLSLKYVGGKKKVIVKDNGYNAGTELCFSLGYTFGKKLDSNSIFKVPHDSIPIFFSLKYFAGTSLSFNVGDNKSFYKPGAGFNAGLSLLFQKTKSVSFEADVLYQQNNYWLNDSSSSYFYADTASLMYYTNTRTDLDYLSIPLIMNFKFGQKARFYAGIGLFASVQLNAQVVGHALNTTAGENYLTTTEYHVYDSIEGYFSDFDSGWLLNCGFETPLFKKLKFDCNFRYNASFKNIYKNDNDQIIKIKSLSINAGIIIPII